ncbi:MAG TPA: hypothetical protein VI299_29905 [Polyangiales bacterium]
MRLPVLLLLLSVTSACDGEDSAPQAIDDAQVSQADADADRADDAGHDAAFDGASPHPEVDANLPWVNDAGELVCGAPGDVLRPQSAAEIAGCTIYRGEITIADVQWTNLDGFESPRIVEGDVALFRSAKLEDLRGLANLEKVGGVFSIHLCDSLTTLSHLTSLREVGDLSIREEVNRMLAPAEVDALRARVKILGIPDAGL